MDYTPILEFKRNPLAWQKQGLQQTASGYGSKLTTEYMVRITGSIRWHRVYAICWSNVASFYVVWKHTRLFLRDSQLQEFRDKS